MIPLSFAQRRLWFLNRLEGPSATYNAPVVLRLDGVPDAVALGAAVTDLAARHETLRTVFPATDGEPYQLVLEPAEVALATEECAPQRLDAAVQAFTRETFDIVTERPLRARLFTPGDGTSVLVLLVHHVATDGLSVAPLLDDLAEAYRARLAGGAPAWDELPVQYADYALWQHDMLGDPLDPESVAFEQLEFWREALAELPAVIELPADRPRPAEPTHRGVTLNGRVDAGTHRALLALARSRSASLFMVARAALAAALSAAGAGEDLAIGSPVAGRPEEDLHALVGFFINSLALRTDLSGDPSLGALVDRVRDADLAAFDHEDLPFDLLVEHLNPARELGRHPFFQVMLTVAAAAGEPPALGGLTARTADADLAAAKFDLTFYCAETTGDDGEPGGLEVGLQYAVDLFDGGTAQLLLEVYLRALRAFAADGGVRLSALELLSAPESAGLAGRRERLAELAAARVTPVAAGDEGGTRVVLAPREEILCGLFAEVLGRDHIGPDDNFFRNGGHSLLASKLINRLRAVLGTDIGIRDLFLAPTPTGLHHRIDTTTATTRPTLHHHTPDQRPHHIPLSYAQRRLWFLDERDGAGSAYNVPIVLHLDRAPDPLVLAGALADVAARHEVLRTVYRAADGEPYQVVLADTVPVLETVATTPDSLAAAVDAAAGHVFDLAAEIPFRGWLLDPGTGRERTLVLLLHHIAADGWSTGPLLADLARAVAARSAGDAAELPPLPVAYADYALWQRELLGDAEDESSLMRRQIAFWKQALAGLPASTPLPADRPRPAEPSGRGATVSGVRLDAGTHRELAALSRTARATLFMVARSALAVALSAAGAGDDLAIGVPVAGRSHQDLHDLAGLFVNTLVLRAGLDGDPTVRELVERSREYDLAAYAHDDLPFDLLVEHLNPARELGRHPFFQVMLTHQRGEAEAVTIGGGTARATSTDLAAAKFDLTFHCAESQTADGEPAGLELGVQYAVDLFDQDTATLLLQLFARALTAFAAAPHSPVAGLLPLSPAEERGLAGRRERLAAAEAEAARAAARTVTAGGAGPVRTVLAPREEILCGLFAEVLGRDHIGPDDNFFRNGGHSLLASKLINRLRAVLGTDIGIRDLFLAPTPTGLHHRIDTTTATTRPTLHHHTPDQRPHHIPLSYAQRRLWFVNQLEGPSATYNIAVVRRLDRRLDPAVLGEALADVAGRHEVLRTVYPVLDGEPYQRVLDGVRPVLERVETTPEQVPATVDAATAHVFDLAADLPLRGWLLDPGADQAQVMVLLVHHIAFDGWSTDCLLADLALACAARRDGHAPDWQPLPAQYADYTLWQRELLGDADDPESLMARQLAYWGEALDGLAPVIDLITDRPRPAEPSGRGALTPFGLDAATHRALTRVAHECGATLFMVVQAALAATLTRHGAGTDLALGTTVAGRSDDALHPLAGLFVNTLVLRTRTDGDPAFADLVRRVRETDLAAYGCQDVPFDRLVEHLNPHRSSAHHPLVQVMLQVNAASTAGPAADGDGMLAGVQLPFGTDSAKTDLTFALTEERDRRGEPAGLSGVLEYATDLFDAATAALLAERLADTLRTVAADPAVRLGDIGPAGDAPHSADGPARTTVHDGVRQRAGATPELIALSCGDETLTYGELDRRATRLAGQLAGSGVGRGTTVAVLVERGTDLVVAALAVLMCGAAPAMLDVDGDVPGALALLGAPVVLTRAAFADRAARGAARMLRLESMASATPAGLPRCGPPDAAAVCLTAGPDGGARAVRISHGTAAAGAFGGLRHVDAATGTWAFARDLWSALLGGGSCVLRPARPLTGAPAAPGGYAVLDARLRPVPAGVPGELYLRGAGDGDGFPALPGATAAAWVPDPFGPAGARMLRTGRRAVLGAAGDPRDLGPLAGDGDVGGYRAETDRVARTLTGHPAVGRTAVVVREDVPGQRRLVAYLVPAGAGTVTEADLQSWAAERLPDYLVPSAVVVLESLPVGADGRTDRAALPAPERRAPGSGPAPQEVPDDGRGRWEEPLSRLFSEVLEGRQVGADDNFFRVGGHSLLAVRLVNRVRAELGQEITLRDVFRFPTVTTLARWFATEAAAAPGTAAAGATPAPSAGPDAVPNRPTLRRRTAGGSRTRT
ncbi:condensation domain-containing protein [Streptantibioticus silvisoli]|uniref:Condensation domain-containing protein n=1 Tax=Streptantibioticus silvisoli TaxID=2705255 RepID=A0ABT6VXY0_9ACTN|nr:condensation domain-containing protein [Streptantibioticus silvisoli]MDI5963341.1 condensation domain-containing protein [Streptantibioticus silvisoli]